MSCLWCLERCVALEAGGQEEEPLIDLTEVLKDAAWGVVRAHPPRALSLGERVCGLNKVLTLDVDRSFLSVLHADTLDLQPRLVGGGAGGTGGGGVTQPLPPPSDPPQGTTFLFQSQFHNDTTSRQTYSFKTERQTRSLVEMSLQRGFTLGQSLELDVKVPTGVKGCKLSGKLGGQMQWSFTRGKVSRQEEQVTWSVDSHVDVAPNTTGVATLAVQECRWTADFSLRCVVRPRGGDNRGSGGQADGGKEDSDQEEEGAELPTPKFPVFVRRRATGELLQVVNIPPATVVSASPRHFSRVEGGGVECTLRGQCHAVCAVNQRVWLKEAELIPSMTRPAILHQDSVIISND